MELRRQIYVKTCSGIKNAWSNYIRQATSNFIKNLMKKDVLIIQHSYGFLAHAYLLLNMITDPCIYKSVIRSQNWVKMDQLQRKCQQFQWHFYKQMDRKQKGLELRWRKKQLAHSVELRCPAISGN